MEKKKKRKERTRVGAYKGGKPELGNRHVHAMMKQEDPPVHDKTDPWK